jgi:uncharacterized membrane protein
MFRRIKDQVFKQPWNALIPLALVAILFRLPTLTKNELWYDELQTVTHASLPFLQIFKSIHIFDPHPPLYYLQLHAWMSLGTSDLWLRLNPFIFSLAAVICSYLVFKKHFNERTALISGFTLALLPLAVHHSQNVRMYSFSMLLALLSWSSHRSFLEAPSLTDAFLTTLWTVSLLYSHGTSFLILPALWVNACLYFMKFKSGKIAGQWIALQAAILVLYFPWISVARKKTDFVSNTYVVNLHNLTEVLGKLFIGLGNPIPQTIFHILGITVIFLVGTSLVFEKNRDFVISMIISPILAAIVLSNLVHPIWHTRTIIFVLPFLAFSLASVVDRLAVNLKIWFQQVFIARLTVILFLVFLCGMTIYQEKSYSAPWSFRQAAENLSKHAKKGDLIYCPNYRDMWALGWFLEGPGRINPLDNIAIRVRKSGAILVSWPTVIPFFESGRSTWIVTHNKDRIFLPKSLMMTLKLLKTGEFNGLYIFKTASSGTPL